MSKLSIALTVAVAVVGTAGLVMQQQSISALRREVGIMKLQQQADKDDVARAVASAARSAQPASGAPSNDSATSRPAGGLTAADNAEVTKLREEVNNLKKTTQAIAGVIQAAQAKSTDAQIPTKLLPVAEFKNGGWAAPASAMETVLWAATSGDVDVLAQGLGLTATAKAKADAWFAQLADTTKAQYGSPEKVLALMIARDAASLSGMQVLGQTEMAPDQSAVRVRLGTEDGKTKDDTLVFRQTGNAWRMVIPDQVVEKYAKQLAASGKK